MRRPSWGPLLFVLLLCGVATEAQEVSLDKLIERAKWSYEDGDYERVVEVLSGNVPETSEGARARAILVASLLKVGRMEEAQAEVNLLRETAGEDFYAQVGAKLETLVNRAAEEAELEAKLSGFLADYRRGEARALVDGLEPSERQSLLQLYLDLYVADFEGARGRLADLEAQGLTSEQAGRVQEEIVRREEAWLALVEKLDFLYYSGHAGSIWSPDSAFGQGSVNKWRLAEFFSLPEFFEVVDGMVSTAPLAERSIEAQFHAALLGLETEDFLATADSLMKAYGQLRLACLGERQYFWLIFDGENGRLRTEKDPRKFFVIKGAKQKEQPVKWMTPRTEHFDLPLAAITAVVQNTDHSSTGTLERGAYVLKLEPTGAVPRYMFLDPIDFYFGEQGQKKVTRKLGDYVVHLIGDRPITAKLEDPDKRGGGFGRTMSMIGAVAGAAGGAMGTGAQATQLTQQSMFLMNEMGRVDQERAAAGQRQRLFESEFAMELLDSFAGVDFDEIEELLGLAGETSG